MDARPPSEVTLVHILGTDRKPQDPRLAATEASAITGNAVWRVIDNSHRMGTDSAVSRFLHRGTVVWRLLVIYIYLASLILAAINFFL